MFPVADDTLLPLRLLWAFQVREDAQKAKELQRVLYSNFDETVISVQSEDGTTADRKHTKVTLVMANKAMLQVAAKHGHRQPLFMDTTFAINRYKFSFLSVLALDDSGKGVPCMWAVLPDEQAETIDKALRVFDVAVKAEQQDWEPSCFITDDSDAEQKAVRCASHVQELAALLLHVIWTISYGLLLWHMRGTCFW